MKKQDNITGVKVAVIFSIALSIYVFDAFHLNGTLGTHLPSFFSQCAPLAFGSSKLAHDESGGFFTDIRESDWNILKERLSTTPPCQEKCGPEEPHVWYQNNWEPAFTCLQERRIGRWGDGGKWVCDPHRIARKEAVDPCLVYSIGSNNDFSFEEAVLNDISVDCEIHTFDPTVGDNPSNLPNYGNITFHPWGLAAKDEGAYKTLPTMIKGLSHDTREIDILKIDCEGCEWTSFSNWFERDVAIRQILIELHQGTVTAENNPPPALQFMNYLQSKGYTIFHKEANTIGCKGSCIEYGLSILIPTPTFWTKLRDMKT